MVSPSDDNLLNAPAPRNVRWKGLLRSGTNARREDRKNMFYPIYIDPKERKVVRVGKSLAYPEEPNFSSVDGLEVAWPIRTDKSYGNWGVGFETFEKLVHKGYVSVGGYDKKRRTWSISYISLPNQKLIETGDIIITGRDETTGTVTVEYANKDNRAIKTVWHRTSHDAGAYGSDLLTKMLGKTKAFSFPKSIFSEKDSISSIVRNNKDALILDFFAGSGTTLHAVNLLNAEDGGHRRCIMVTNNEVSAEEADYLRKQGFKPGNTEWEKHGVARYVTWPRTICSIKGVDVYGNPLPGTYATYHEYYEPDEDNKGLYRKTKFADNEILASMKKADGFKANAIYFKLGFLDKNQVSLGMQFKELLPIIWMKVGAIGPCPCLTGNIPDMMILPQNRIAILVDESESYKFISEMEKHPEIETVFIVTDSEDGFHEMSAMLNVKKTYQLYRDYLDNFKITWR